MAHGDGVVTKLTWPVYALTLEPESPADHLRERGRLVHVSAEGGSHVALFTSEALAREWVRANAAANSVLRPMAIAGRAELITLLRSLSQQGDRCVCFNPNGTVGGIADIDQLLAALGS